MKPPSPLRQTVRRLLRGTRFANRHTERVFTRFFEENGWGGSESVSGTGSDLSQTLRIVDNLPALLGELGVRRMLDLPCGDFHWMSRVRLDGIHYIGGDIVRPLVRQNRRLFGGPGREFRVLDLVTGRLPRVDLVFCRDCLVHLPLEAGMQSLANIRRSGSSYILSTTFPAATENPDIPTGKWRRLNLEKPPFCLPPPLRVLAEGCTESQSCADKSLGLWRVSDLPACR